MPTAATGLEQAAELDPKAPEIGFFLGACYLLTGRDEAAVTRLRRTVALGRTPYYEEARFYLAKAHLRTGDVGAARVELASVAQHGGEFANEARRCVFCPLERIQGLPR